MGTVHLSADLELKKVLCVSLFKYNLLSVQQLITDNDCQVLFHPTHCVILDKITNQIKGIGQAKNSLYYMDNHLPVTVSSVQADKAT